MKTKTLKKALSLFLAVLMIALAIPFTLLTVAADEATKIDITDFSVFGRHTDGTNLFFNVDLPASRASDGNINTEAQTKNGSAKSYEMCYFDTDGVKTQGENPNGKSYYGIFVIELSNDTVVDTLSLWGIDDWGYGWMSNDAYDIYYSTDGNSYVAVDGASFDDVCEKQSTDDAYYVEGTYGDNSGYVHNIDINETCKYIAIAVSTPAYESCGYSDSDDGNHEMIFFEIVVMGTEVEEPIEPPLEEATKRNIVDFSFFGNHLDGTTSKKVYFYDSYKAGYAYDGDITTDAQIENAKFGYAYEMCYFDAEGVMQNGTNPDGDSYYGMFIIELDADAEIDTLSLWTTYVNASNAADRPYMANNGYDIYYSENGEKYAAVKDATFSDVYTERETNGLYVEGEYGGKSGHVHTIDMKGVTAKYIVIAVSELVSGADEALVSEVVVTGTAPKLMLKTGASVRMDAPTGLRFTGLVSKSYVEKLESEGETVTMGMLITPTDYLEGIEFTKAALDGKTFDTPAYLEIDAAEETVKEDGDYYVIKCVIAKIKEANYDREFSAILYVKVDGEIVAYSDYNEVFNSRSVAEVAEAAYCDLKDAKDDTYKYEAKTFEGEAEVTKYSRYDTTQRETLYGFFGQREQ